MEKRAQPTGWIEAIGWFSICVAFASALVIFFDIFGRGYRQKMWIMNLVYPMVAG